MNFVRSLALRTASEFVTKGASTILMLVSARVLGAEQFGVLSVAWATGWLAALVGDMGLHMIATRRAAVGTDDQSELAGVVLVAKAGFTLTAAAGLAAASLYVLDGRFVFVMCAVGFGQLFLSFVDLFQHLLRGRGSFHLDAALQVGARLTTLVFGLGGLAYAGLRGLATGVLVAGLASAFGAGGAFAADCGKPALGPQPRQVMRGVVAEALPVGVGMLASVLAFRIDVYLLEAMRDAATVGLYSSAYKVFEATRVLPAIAMTVVFPRLAVRDGDGQARAALRGRSLVALGGLGLGLAVAGTVAAGPLIAILFGVEYLAAVPTLVALFWAVPFMFVNYLLTQDLIAQRRPMAFAVASFVALAANVTTNVVAIPRYGLVGAAVATVVTEGVLFAACLAAPGGRPRSRVLRPGRPLPGPGREC